MFFSRELVRAERAHFVYMVTRDRTAGPANDDAELRLFFHDVQLCSKYLPRMELKNATAKLVGT